MVVNRVCVRERRRVVGERREGGCTIEAEARSSKKKEVRFFAGVSVSGRMDGKSWQASGKLDLEARFSIGGIFAGNDIKLQRLS